MASGDLGHDARVPDPDDYGEVSGASGTGEDGVPRGGVPTTDAPAWLQPIIRILAEVQLELATKDSGHKPRSVLATLNLEEFRGGCETTTHQYRAWKKQTIITQKLYVCLMRSWL